MNAPEVPEAPIPICPHCDGELAAMAVYMWHMGALIAMSMYCSHCLRILHSQILPANAPMEESRIARPS